LPGADLADDRAELRDRLAVAVREAGALALQTFRAQLKSWTKGASSPVSEADLAVDALLRERLLTIRPVGWLSEETEDDPARLACDEIWVVDPIDGTRAYLAGRREWAISAALVSRGRPVVAVLYAPALGEMFLAIAGSGTEGNKDGSFEEARFADPQGMALDGDLLYVADRKNHSRPRLRCGLPGSPWARLTARSPDPTAMIGTLQRPIFWCTKLAASSRP